jgi:hypothetical protein
MSQIIYIRNKTSSPRVNKLTSDANKRLSLIAEFIFKEIKKKKIKKIVFITAHDEHSICYIIYFIQLEGKFVYNHNSKNIAKVMRGIFSFFLLSWLKLTFANEFSNTISIEF